MLLLLIFRHASGLSAISLIIPIRSSFFVCRRLQLPTENGGNVCSRCFVFSLMFWLQLASRAS